jgi:hypothetical protein
MAHLSILGYRAIVTGATSDPRGKSGSAPRKEAAKNRDWLGNRWVGICLERQHPQVD